jgi:hypothetical protein
VPSSGAPSKCAKPSKELTTSAIAIEAASEFGSEPDRALSHQRCPHRKQWMKAPGPASSSGRVQSSGSIPYRKASVSGSSKTWSEISPSSANKSTEPRLPSGEPAAPPLPPDRASGIQAKPPTAKHAAIQPSSACTLTATHEMAYHVSRLATARGNSPSDCGRRSFGGGSCLKSICTPRKMAAHSSGVSAVRASAIAPSASVLETSPMCPPSLSGLEWLPQCLVECPRSDI